MTENTPTELATEHVKRSALGFDEAISGPMFDAWLANHDAEVRALPDREETIEGLRVAMLGTTDGDFIHPESPIPAGEMFRLASEYLEALFGQEGQR